jgi:hypothetical protein
MSRPGAIDRKIRLGAVFLLVDQQPSSGPCTASIIAS